MVAKRGLEGREGRYSRVVGFRTAGGAIGPIDVERGFSEVRWEVHMDGLTAFVGSRGELAY